MKINYGYIREENRAAYISLFSLKDHDGHFALTAAHRKIIDYIGSMPGTRGCFAGDTVLNAQSIVAKSPKTLRRHLQYLIAIKAIKKTVEDGRRVLRLLTLQGTVPSQKTYRTNKGMSEYSYARTKEAEKNTEVIMQTPEVVKEEIIDTSWFDEPTEAVFLSNDEANFAEKTANLPEKTANFATILYKESLDSLKTLPPKGSLQDSVFEVLDQSSETCLLATLADEPGSCQAHAEGPPAPQNCMKISKFFEEQSESLDEPLIIPKKRGKKRANTQAERKLDASKAHANGHVVNPLGIVNNRPRKLCPKAARDIEPTGSVTVPKLYRHLIKLFDDAFGVGIIAQMLPDDKTAVTAYFDRIRQKFIDACQYDPSYRDLAEYFSWFLEPSHVAKILAANKYAGQEKGLIHFNQMIGLAYIRKFFDANIKKKLQDGFVASTKSEKIEAVISEVNEAFKEMEYTQSDSTKFVLSMFGCGYAMGAEFLYERNGLDADECRARIICDMAEFIRRADGEEKREKKVKSLRRAAQETLLNRKILDDKCVWYDLDRYMNNLVEDALRKFEDGRENGNRSGDRTNQEGSTV